MADQKITELTTTTPVDTDEGVLQRGSANFKFLMSALRTYLSATFLSDAPADGSTYGRKNNAWSAIAGSSAHVVKDETVSLTQRTNINFTGAGVTATDNAGTDSTDVTIPNPVTGHESTFNHASYDTHLAAASPHSGHLDTGDLGVTVQAFDANTAKTNVTRAWTKQQYFTPITGPATGAAAPDWTNGNVVHSTLTGNLTSIAAPVGVSDGATVVWRIKQDATGGRTAAGWNAAYKFSAGGTAITLSTTANAYDVLILERFGSDYLVSKVQDYR